jgi:AraC-like DNA-binding protein
MTGPRTPPRKQADATSRSGNSSLVFRVLSGKPPPDDSMGIPPNLAKRPELEPASLGAQRYRRDDIMQRFHEVVLGYPDRDPAITTLCRLIGVPQRTLNLYCQEILGMSAKSFLVLRRYHQANQMLIQSGSSAPSVTDVATHFGFWNFGRFSREYRVIFGEMPSRTRQDAIERSS